MILTCELFVQPSFHLQCIKDFTIYFVQPSFHLTCKDFICKLLVFYATLVSLAVHCTLKILHPDVVLIV